MTVLFTQEISDQTTRLFKFYIMIYINEDDLTTDSYQRFIETSSSDISTTLSKTEARVIAIVKTYISDRYDVKSIFPTRIINDDEEEGEEEEVIIGGIRDEVLIDIISKKVLYRIFRRNAARKIPTDVKDDYDDAIKMLEKIRRGEITLNGLPPALDDEGQIISHSIWGNNTNIDHYI